MFIEGRIGHTELIRLFLHGAKCIWLPGSLIWYAFYPAAIKTGIRQCSPSLNVWGFELYVAKL